MKQTLLILICCIAFWNCSNSVEDVLSDSAEEKYISEVLVIDTVANVSDTTSITTDSLADSTDTTSVAKDTLADSTDTTSVAKDSLADSTDTTSVAKDTLADSADTTSVVKDTLADSTDTTSVAKDTLADSTDTTSVAKDTLADSTDTTSVAKDTLVADEVYYDDNLERGSFFSQNPIILYPPKETDGVVNRCTFDGSMPEAETSAFSEPKVLKQNTAVRCMKFGKGKNPDTSRAIVFFIGEKVKMPVVSIVVDPEYVENYISAPPCSPNPCSAAKFWEEVEEPVFVEYFPNGSNSTESAFAKNAGVKISGGWSRNQEKKSITIVMRKQYEKGRIDYPLFETRPENSSFKSFLLRNNGNRYVSDYFVDAMGASLLEGTGLDYQRSRQVVVFYNGIYHGIHDMREKENEYYVENNHGISSENVNFVEHSQKTIEEKNGSLTEYKNILNFAVSHDFSGPDNKFYEEIGKKLDLSNYANYMAAEIFYHNGDWPNNNVRAWSAPGQPWKFIVFDLDHGFDWTGYVSGFGQNVNMIQWIMQGGAPAHSCSGKFDAICFHSLFVSLIKNPDFKRMFLNHASVLYARFINGDKASKVIDKMYASLDPDEVNRDLKAFPRRGYTNSCGGNFDVSGSCARQWMYQRDSTVWDDFRQGLDMGEKVQVEFEPVENGSLYIEDILLPQSGLKAQFFVDNEILIRAEASSSHEFVSWMDGSTENPRLITPEKGMKIKALFQ